MDLSVIIPCYNEEPHLRESTRILSAVLDKTRYEYEIVFVDDCSTDHTRDVIETLCHEPNKCRYIFHEANKGRGGAFKTGFRESSGRIVGFIDIDLEVGAHYVPELVRLIDEENYDVATGYRHYLLRQTKSLLRTFLSNCYRLTCKLLLNFGVDDSETGCKFFKRVTASEAVLGSAQDGWFWDTEVMARAALGNLRVKELPVLFLRRFEKQSTVKIFRDSWDYLVALARFRGQVGLGLIDRSPIYWSAVGYDLVMRIIWGSRHRKILREAAQLIPAGASVSEVCCGTGTLYRKYLRERDITYLGMDNNGHFIMALKQLGIASKLHDLRNDEIDPADYVVICASFYHFAEEQEDVLRRMRAAARTAVIICEPVKNYSHTLIGPFGKLANWLTKPGSGSYQYRFTPESFQKFSDKFGASEFVMEPGDAVATAVFKGTRKEQG
jgi:glycosyltransferase involved in cell wall biosynthesis